MPAHLVEKRDLVHLVAGKGEVARRVLDENPAAQPGLDNIQVAQEQRESGARIRHRQQVGKFLGAAVVTRRVAPAQMVGNAGGLIAFGQRRELRQFGQVRALGRAQRQRGRMKTQRHAFGNGGQPAMRRTAAPKVVLRVDFDPLRVPDGPRRGPNAIPTAKPCKHVGIMLGFETDTPSSGQRAGRGQGGHGVRYRPG